MFSSYWYRTRCCMATTTSTCRTKGNAQQVISTTFSLTQFSMIISYPPRFFLPEFYYYILSFSSWYSSSFSNLLLAAAHFIFDRIHLHKIGIIHHTSARTIKTSQQAINRSRQSSPFLFLTSSSKKQTHTPSRQEQHSSQVPRKLSKERERD